MQIDEKKVKLTPKGQEKDPNSAPKGSQILQDFKDLPLRGKFNAKEVSDRKKITSCLIIKDYCQSERVGPLIRTCMSAKAITPTKIPSHPEKNSGGFPPTTYMRVEGSDLQVTEGFTGSHIWLSLGGRLQRPDGREPLFFAYANSNLDNSCSFPKSSNLILACKDVHM